MPTASKAALPHRPQLVPAIKVRCQSFCDCGGVLSRTVTMLAISASAASPVSQ